MIGRLTAPRMVGAYLLLLLYYAFFLIPIIWIVLSSFKTNSAIIIGNIIPSPSDLTFSSYSDVWNTPGVPTFLRNSFIIALGVTAISLLVSSLGAYGLSKYRTRGRRSLLMLILTSQTFPGVLILVPFYTLILQVNLNDTFLGIILAQTSGVLPFCMWTLKSYMDAVPDALVEASLIDGSGKLGTYLRVVLPTSLPGLAVAAFYAFAGSWGDYLFVSVISGSDNTGTLPIFLYRISTSQQMTWGAVAATTVIAIAPIMVIFAFVQRWMIEGLLAGAVKS
ncbi:MAG TPA: carbohydrate ABC transporter permease [Chloroflexota bacterium]|nr:carbohydrate ABC transporter permease [Chloroflexota bacterium]